MRILYFLDYGKNYGGAVNTLIQQACIMRGAGHSVEVFISDYCGEELGQQTIDKLDEYSIIPERMTYQISNNPEDIDVVCIDENYEKCYEIIKESQADILHSIQLNPLVELISRGLKLPHIMNIYPFLDVFFKVQYVDIFPKYMTCDSYYWGEKWQKRIGVDFACIRTAVTRSGIKEQKITPNNIKCIMVGDIYKGKNQLSVIKGFEESLKADFCGTLDIYGNDHGDYANECKKYVIDNALENWITFHGFVSDMDSVYKNSDVLICGSTRESYPNVISEALSYGLLIISSPVAGVPEVIIDGENGILTEGYEKEDFSKALIRAKEFALNGKADEITVAEVETAKNVHSKEKVYEGLLSFYHKVMNNPLCSHREYLIDDFRSDFGELIRSYKKVEPDFSDKKYIRSKLWYLFYWRNAIVDEADNGRSIYLWGAGNNAKKVLELMRAFLPEVKIEAVIDSNKKGKYEDYTIISPEDYFDMNNGVALLSLFNGQTEVIERLQIEEKRYGKDYFVLGPREW